MSARPRKPPTQDPIEDSPTTIYDSSEDHRPGGARGGAKAAATILDKPQPAKTVVDPPKTRKAGPTLVDKPVKGKPLEIRAYLQNGKDTLSETWSYQLES